MPERTYIFSYTMRDGSRWSFDLQALDNEDAHARLLAIRQNGQVDGEVHERFPAWQLPFRQVWWAIRG